MSSRYQHKFQPSDALETVKFAILDGMTERADITKFQANNSELMIEDIIGSLFDSSTLWALKKLFAEAGDDETP